VPAIISASQTPLVTREVTYLRRRNSTRSSTTITRSERQTHSFAFAIEGRTSNRSVTSARTKTTLSGLKICSMTGTDTANDEPQRKRVTGGILRSSSQNPVYDIARARVFLARYRIFTEVGIWGEGCRAREGPILFAPAVGVCGWGWTRQRNENVNARPVRLPVGPDSARSGNINGGDEVAEKKNTLDSGNANGSENTFDFPQNVDRAHALLSAPSVV